MPDVKTEAIQIDHTLYNRLREFCDHENIRFSDFLTDSLENALDSENIVKPLESEIEKLEKKAVKYDYAFNRGFQQGFLFLYLMFNGLNVSRSFEEELKIVRKFPAEAPKGEQIGLF
jgi:hypothetical protein